MRAQEFLLEFDVFEDYDTIGQTMRQAGYTELGSGSEASVWTKDVGTVIKIIVPEDDAGLDRAVATFKKFYEFCMSHQDLKCVPRFIKIQGQHYAEFTIDGNTYLQIAMEQLYPIKNNSFEEAMVWYMSYYVSENKEWPEVKELLSDPQTWAGTDFESVAEELANRVRELSGPIEKDYKILYNVMMFLYLRGKINKMGWDLHTENVMQRKNGDLVIIDPWFSMEEDLNENFADGKVKGKSRPGRVKRAGASCSGSVTDLRAKAAKYGGERGKMYHWCANMKSGRNK